LKGGYILKKGIVFEIGITDFLEAVSLVEKSFVILDMDEWLQVKKSNDFDELALYLKTIDVEHKLFELKE
jgi:hypothetical protein